jgi:hypothetical protein
MSVTRFSPQVLLLALLAGKAISTNRPVFLQSENSSAIFCRSLTEAVMAGMMLALDIPAPDPDNIPMPDPDAVPPVPDPGDVPMPDPGDVPPVPDSGDAPPVPDPGDVPMPDPGDLPPVPDPDEAPPPLF